MWSTISIQFFKKKLCLCFIKHEINIMKKDRMLTQTVLHATSKN